MFDLLDQSRKNRLACSLEAIQKNHSNFYAGVKSVLQEASHGSGIIKGCQWKTFLLTKSDCLRIALGASSQHIIVEDEGAATRAIEHLKKSFGSGSLSFRGNRYPYLAEKESKTGGNCPSKLAVWWTMILPSGFSKTFLGVTAILIRLKARQGGCSQVAYQVRIVTLDGTELHWWFPMQGCKSKQ